jgi:hypothetical protein
MELVIWINEQAANVARSINPLFWFVRNPEITDIKSGDSGVFTSVARRGSLFHCPLKAVCHVLSVFGHIVMLKDSSFE